MAIITSNNTLWRSSSHPSQLIITSFLGFYFHSILYSHTLCPRHDWLNNTSFHQSWLVCYCLGQCPAHQPQGTYPVFLEPSTVKQGISHLTRKGYMWNREGQVKKGESENIFSEVLFNHWHELTDRRAKISLIIHHDLQELLGSKFSFLPLFLMIYSKWPQAIKQIEVEVHCQVWPVPSCSLNMSGACISCLCIYYCPFFRGDHWPGLCPSPPGICFSIAVCCLHPQLPTLQYSHAVCSLGKSIVKIYMQPCPTYVL